MSRQYSETVRTARQAAVESAVGSAPVIKFFAEAMPASCAEADSGTPIAVGTLPSDWLDDASGGARSKLGTWIATGEPAAGTGTALAHYRIYASDGITCHEQGTVTVTGGGGDMTLDQITLEEGQIITIATYSIEDGNA